VNVKGNYFYNAGWGVAFDCNTAGTARGNFSELSEMVSWSPGSVFSGNNLSDGGVIVVADTAKIESNNFYGSPSGVSLDHAGARVTDNKFMYTQAVSFNCYTATVTGNTIIGGEYNGAVNAYNYPPKTFTSSDTLINVPNLYYGSCP
jgi:hypothetical protein